MTTKNVIHFGQKKSVRAFVVHLVFPVAELDREEAFAAEFVVSNEGPDAGYVLAVDWSLLTDPKKGIEDGNIRFRERETKTKWKSMSVGDRLFAIPEICESKCYQMTDDKRVTVVSQTENWTFTNTGIDATGQTHDGLVARATELEAKVNKMLNR